MFFHTTGKSFASPCAGRKDDSGSTLNTPFFIPSGDAGLVECLWVLLCPAGFEIFSFVVTVLGGNWYALLRTVPPNPPGGSFLELPAAVGSVAAVAVGSVGAAGLRRGTVLHCFVCTSAMIIPQPERLWYNRPTVGGKFILCKSISPLTYIDYLYIINK